MPITVAQEHVSPGARYGAQVVQAPVGAGTAALAQGIGQAATVAGDIVARQATQNAKIAQASATADAAERQAKYVQTVTTLKANYLEKQESIPSQEQYNTAMRGFEQQAMTEASKGLTDAMTSSLFRQHVAAHQISQVPGQQKDYIDYVLDRSKTTMIDLAAGAGQASTKVRPGDGSFALLVQPLAKQAADFHAAGTFGEKQARQATIDSAMTVIDSIERERLSKGTSYSAWQTERQGYLDHVATLVPGIDPATLGRMSDAGKAQLLQEEINLGQHPTYKSVLARVNTMGIADPKIRAGVQDEWVRQQSFKQGQINFAQSQDDRQVKKAAEEVVGKYVDSYVKDLYAGNNPDANNLVRLSKKFTEAGKTDLFNGMLKHAMDAKAQGGVGSPDLEAALMQSMYSSPEQYADLSVVTEAVQRGGLNREQAVNIYKRFESMQAALRTHGNFTSTPEYKVAQSIIDGHTDKGLIALGDDKLRHGYATAALFERWQQEKKAGRPIDPVALGTELGRQFAEPAAILRLPEHQAGKPVTESETALRGGDVEKISRSASALRAQLKRTDLNRRDREQMVKTLQTLEQRILAGGK